MTAKSLDYAGRIQVLLAKATTSLAKYHWFCAGCGALGTVDLEPHEDMALVIPKAFKDHAKAQPKCKRSHFRLTLATE